MKGCTTFSMFFSLGAKLPPALSAAARSHSRPIALLPPAHLPIFSWLFCFFTGPGLRVFILLSARELVEPRMVAILFISATGETPLSASEPKRASHSASQKNLGRLPGSVKQRLESGNLYGEWPMVMVSQVAR